MLLAACQTPAPAAPAGQSESPPQTAAPKPVKGGSLIVALSAEVVDMDPANRGGTPTAAAEQLVFNSLVRNTPNQQIKADLAASWTVDEDKWTFKLRQGVKFHDGNNPSSRRARVDLPQPDSPTMPVRGRGPLSGPPTQQTRQSHSQGPPGYLPGPVQLAQSAHDGRRDRR